MIQHYALYEINKLTDRYALTDGLPKGVKPRYNIAPVQAAPVVVRSGDSTIVKLMSWGLVSQGAKDTNSVFRYKTFNVQSEKVFSKASWDSAVRTTRCIIPANGFYMIRSDNNDAYYFTNGSNELMSMAGIYSEWTDSDGTTHSSYSLLTIDSNAAMPLPFGRMPVLIHPQDEKTWLNPHINDLSSLVTCMRPYEGDVLSYRRVASDVASNKLDAPSLIEPLQK